MEHNLYSILIKNLQTHLSLQQQNALENISLFIERKKYDEKSSFLKLINEV